MKFVHLPFKGKDHELNREVFESSFAEAIAANPDIPNYLSKAGEDLNPLRVLDLFKRIPYEVHPFPSPPFSPPLFLLVLNWTHWLLGLRTARH